MTKPPHEFHIPVMGTGFTVDTPIKAAKYGISSVISLVDDELIEKMRELHSKEAKIPFTVITATEPDARAKRITAYLNLLQALLDSQIKELQHAPFTPDSEITRFYTMLPDSSRKKLYQQMLACTDQEKKQQLQQQLRKLATPGKIDVNIMTKLNPEKYINGEKQPAEYADALAALRGYANSKLDSSIIFSAGFNPQLYGYLAEFKDFHPDENGQIKKKVILKVTDYRSSVIQGKYLAKRGIWVSEFRVESALNCGGHAFANDGYLLGPILEEFKEKRADLIETLYGLYKKPKFANKLDPKIRITVQGGIGTNEEHKFLLNNYQLDATGWGTPFLLVPEIINLDDEHLAKLMRATEKEVFLSDASPLGIPFWNLYNSASEMARRARILAGKPGSLCKKGYAKINSEFTKTPICVASFAYQKLKLAWLETQKFTKEQYEQIKEDILSKSCICHDLAGSATKKYGIDKEAKTAICPGPNIANFSKIASLEDMLNHIYGRMSLLTNNNRPHMFIKELSLHIENLQKETKLVCLGLLNKPQKKLQETKENLLLGIEYYKKLAKKLAKEQQQAFLDNLEKLRIEISDAQVGRLS